MIEIFWKNRNIMDILVAIFRQSLFSFDEIDIKRSPDDWEVSKQFSLDLSDPMSSFVLAYDSIASPS